MHPHHTRCPSITLALLCVLGRAQLRAQQPLTLDAALREARAANVRLPIAAYEARIGLSRVREARAARGVRFLLDGDLHGGTPAQYAGNDGRLQLVAEQPIYDGGALGAGIAIALAEARASAAGFRVAERDLDLEVRVGFAGTLRLERELAFRREGIARLHTYSAFIESRRAAGEAVASDLLKTQVQLGGAEADLADAVRRRDQARLAFNDLLGRDPQAPLDLSPLPPPVPPPDTTPEDWSATPDVQQGAADVAAARAGSQLIAAERRPHVGLALDAGVQPAFTPFGAGLNNGQGRGAEVTLSLSWPLFDIGGYHARREQALLRVDQAKQAEVGVQREARLNWWQARTEIVARYRELAARARTAGVAEDAYLAAASLYRGGGGTALEVLEAFTTWIDASEAASEAELAYRVAEAQVIRWSAP